MFETRSLLQAAERPSRIARKAGLHLRTGELFQPDMNVCRHFGAGLAAAAMMIVCAGVFPASAGAAPQQTKTSSYQATVEVHRTGRILELNYKLHDSIGQKASLGSQQPAPRFSVFKGDREIGSGTFEYG